MIIFSLSLYFGSLLIEHDVFNHNEGENYDVRTALTITFTLTLYVFSFGTLTPVNKAIENGKNAIKLIIDIIENP